MKDIHPTAKVADSVKFYTTSIKIGAHTRIDEGCVFTGEVVIGENVHIAPYSVFHGRNGIEIGDYVGLGAFSLLYSTCDDFSGRSLCNPTVPDELKKLIRGTLTFKPHVISGARVTYLPGITIGEGAGVGAHSLVKKDCEPWTIYAGTPAVAMKKRDAQTYKNLLQIYEGEHECV